MGNTCTCVRHSEIISSSPKGGPIESGHRETAPAAFECEQGTSSNAALVICDGIESSMQETRSENVRSDVEDRIERSKVHWSQLTETDSDLDDEEVAQENRAVFEALKWHPIWGHFFKTFGYDLKPWRRGGEMVVGEKFAEGGQAELFHAKVTWIEPESNEEDLEKGYEWVLKVFKEGTRLWKLQSQWPTGYLQWRAQNLERIMRNLPPETQCYCDVYCGTLLEDGRFAFVMKREHEDLRHRIDYAMLSMKRNHGPFSKDESERIMFHIARGMDGLHRNNIVHRDLKASNVLVRDFSGSCSEYYVADFECSIGVIGTGYFRSPEILQAIKDGTASINPKIFSKEADVYSYGMTCYEVLTGKLPFQEHSHSNYDLVLNGKRLKIPKYVDDWIRELLNRCWDVDCSKRPSFLEIMKILSSKSSAVRKVQLDIQEYEENYNREHVERLSQQGLIVGPK